MPIDSSPEGGEILHQPIVKPFPVNAPADDEDQKREDALKEEALKKASMAGQE